MFIFWPVENCTTWNLRYLMLRDAGWALRHWRSCLVFCCWKCQIWAKNLLKFVFNGLKKHLYICVLTAFRPSFPHLETLKKILENSTLSRYVKKKKKKKKKSTDRPNFQILLGWGQHNNFFFGLMILQNSNTLPYRYKENNHWQRGWWDELSLPRHLWGHYLAYKSLKCQVDEKTLDDFSC